MSKINKEAEIKNYMKSLDISREEAEQLWLDDQDEKGGSTEEQIKLSAKAKKDFKNYTTTEKVHQKKKRERKVDEEKLAILKQIQAVLGGEIEKEVSLHFTVGEVEFSLNLVKHRKGGK